jgi:hypothetical protein
MRKTLLCTLPLLALAACHVDVNDADANGSDGNVHIAMGDDAGGNSSAGTNKISINVPGFNANVSLPEINLGGHLDMEGIKVAPDTRVTGFDAFANDKDGDKKGSAKIAFTNPRAPGALVDYYKGAVADAGFGDIVAGADTLTAKKGDKSFTLAASADGSGSKGTITMVGND